MSSDGEAVIQMVERHEEAGDVGSDERIVCGGQAQPERVFRFVRHQDRARYEAEGWTLAADLGGHHGCYAVLMELVADRG